VKAFVTGANGFIGRRLVEALTVQGHSVSVLTRNPKADFPSGVHVVIGDLVSEKGIGDEVLSGCDVIFHCAGESRNESLMRKLHVDGARRLLHSAIRAAENRGRPIHWVQLSSVGAYGFPKELKNIDCVITENTPEVPAGEYEVTKTESDRLVVEAARSPVLTFSILRPSKVVGREMREPSIRALIKFVQSGIFFYIGRPGAIATYVHVDDVVAALLKCGTDARARGQIYNLSNDCLLEEMIRGIATALGVRPPRIRLPEGLARGIVGAVSGMVPFPLTQERINGLVRRTKYSTTKIEAGLNYKATHSVPEAMREIVVEYRS
jgi:nucleoside-diphosphate-sugar epimerase